LHKAQVLTHISSLDGLTVTRIPVLSGRGSDNNKSIFKTVALRGPLLKYDIHKDTQIEQYSTVSRRVRDLAKRGYLAESGRRVTERGKQTEEAMYGLTWRGFLASLTIRDVREQTIQVLKKNPLLSFPEKELILTVVDELTTPQELEEIIEAILEALLSTTPNLELIDNDPMGIFAWVSSSLDKVKPLKTIKLSKMPKDAEEFLKLLDRPAILQVVKERLIPIVRQQAEAIEVMYRLMSILRDLGDFVSHLEIEDQPSKKVMEYFNAKLSPRLSELSPRGKEAMTSSRGRSTEP